MEILQICQDGDCYEPNSIIFGLQDGYYVAPKDPEVCFFKRCYPREGLGRMLLSSSDMLYLFQKHWRGNWENEMKS